MNALKAFRSEHGLPMGLLVGTPLLLAGSAATFMLYRSGNGGDIRRRGSRRVGDVMTAGPACCGPDTPIREVAQLMVTNDCGELPVCDQAGKPIGVVTDRDIVCRLVAKGHDPMHATANDCMSRHIVTCSPDTSIDECAQRMESHQIRRMPVVDANGAICGMVSQADLARKAPRRITAAIVEEVSKPNVFASAVGGR